MFEIESAARVSKRAAIEAQYHQLLAQLEVAKITATEAKKNYEIAQLAEGLSRKNYERAKQQYEGDATTLESLQTFEENWKSACLQVEIAKNRIESSHADIEATKRSADAALATVETIDTDLSYYLISAPAGGVIGKRWCFPWGRVGSASGRASV